MSFLVSEGEMIRDLWPDACGRPTDDISSLDDLQDWQIIPITFDGVCDAFDIVNDGSDSTGATRHRLVYKNREDDNDDSSSTTYEACLRLQGVVKSNKIGPLGDWNGSPASCPRAVHRLILLGKLDEQVFALQSKGLETIKDFICTHLGSRLFPNAGGSAQSDSLLLERRVFSKVRPTGTVVSELKHTDDPDGLAKKVEQQWVVDHKIGYALQTDTGTRKPCSHLAIRSGDFVDVGVKFEILTRFMKRRKTTSISLAVTDVLRLRISDQVEVLKYNLEEDRKAAAHVIATSSGLEIED